MSTPLAGTELTAVVEPPKPHGPLAAAWAGAKRRWPLAVLVGLLLGGTAGGVYFALTPQKYTVSTVLQVAAADSLLHERQSRGDELDYRRTQAALLRSRPVLADAMKEKVGASKTRTVEQLDLFRDRSDKVGWLEGELKASVSDGGLIRLSMTGENPEELAHVLNAVAASHLKKQGNADREQFELRSASLGKAVEALDKRVRDLRNELKVFSETWKTSDAKALTFRQQMIWQEGSILRKELVAVEGQLRMARADIDVLTQRVERVKTEPVSDPAVSEVLAHDPVVKSVAAVVVEKRSQLDAAGPNLTPGLPAHKRLTDELAAAEVKLAEVRKQRREVAEAAVREANAKAVAATLAEKTNLLAHLERQHAALKRDADAARDEADKIGRGSLDLELKAVEVGEAEALFRRLRSEKEQLELEKDSARVRVKQVVAADPVSAKASTSALTTAAGLGVGGLLLGAMAVGFIESRRRLLVHQMDVARVMRVRVLGTLPEVPGLEDEPLTAVGELRFGLAGYHLLEAVRDVRALLLTGNPTPPQVLMVTSAAQGDGKTTFACLLALSLAQSGKRVLLVDGDLRKPNVADRLGHPNHPGLGELLRKEGATAKKLVGTTLSVLTAGRPCGTVIQGLTAERVRKLLARLRPKYDHIVIDTSPTPLADGLVIGACADAAVLVVRYGRSSEPDVREACERLLAARVPLVGGVVNGTPLDRRWLNYRYPKAADALPGQPPPSDPPVTLTPAPEES